MAEIKAYTDIEQSKKLAEILPHESADMHYVNDKHAGCVPYLEMTKVFNPWLKGVVISPCWSLTALLRVIPKRFKFWNVLRIDITDEDFEIWYEIWNDDGGGGVDDELPHIIKESPVDACVEMILKLHELKLL